MSKWISVKDRFPEPLKWVLAHCKTGAQIRVVMYDHVRDDWDSVVGNTRYAKEVVTHWMELPEPPCDDYN